MGKQPPRQEGQGASSVPAADKGEAASPQRVRSLQVREAAWRRLEAEFGLLTGAEVAELLGADTDYASAKRADHEIVGVVRGGEYRYPGFQFDRARAAVLPVIAPLIDLAHANQWDEESLILWMQSPSTSFEDEDRPVDHLRGDPDAVLAAAKTEFEADW